MGFVPIRKEEGLFPGPKVVAESAPDYRGNRHRLRVQRAALDGRDRVLLVDDWVQTGSQAAAARSIVERCGSTWVGCSVIVDQLDAARLAVVGPVHSLLTADDLPACPPRPTGAAAS